MSTGRIELNGKAILGVSDGNSRILADFSYPLPAPSTYRYFRLQIDANNGDATYAGTYEFELATEPGGATVFTGGTPSGSAWYTTYVPAKAFDGIYTIAQSWLLQITSTPLPQWVQYDLGEGNGVEPYQYTVGSLNTAARGRKDFKLLGSNNGTDWTILNTTTGASGVGSITVVI